MADLLAFPGSRQEPDLEDMDRSQLTALLAQVREDIEALDQIEPEDMDSPDYEAWGDRHEELEDLEDDILERLEDLED